MVLIEFIFENRYSYIADIGDVLVLIAKRKETEESRHHIPTSNSGKPQQRVVCHVLQSPEAEMMSSALGQAFQLAFQIFLQQNGIPAPPEGEQNQELAEMYHDDLVHYSKVNYDVLICKLAANSARKCKRSLDRKTTW